MKRAWRYPLWAVASVACTLAAWLLILWLDKSGTVSLPRFAPPAARDLQNFLFAFGLPTAINLALAWAFGLFAPRRHWMRNIATLGASAVLILAEFFAAWQIAIRSGL